MHCVARQVSRNLSLLLLTSLATLAAAQPGGLPTVGTTPPRPQPLPLTEAFPFYVSEGNQWQVNWNPAPGHYLYRHAFAFSLQTSSAANAMPVAFTVPDGLQKTDQFFGAIEAYYGSVSATLDLPNDLPAGSQLWIEYQGCADWGFCYPPQRTAFALKP